MSIGPSWSSATTLNPLIEISSDEKGTRSYHIPVGARLLVSDESDIQPGQVLVKIPRERSKTRDITGGFAARCGSFLKRVGPRSRLLFPKLMERCVLVV